MSDSKCLLSFEERFRFVSLKLSIYKFTKVDIKYSDLRDLLFSGCCLNYKVCLSPQQKWTSNIKEYKAFISERLVVLKVFLNLSILYKRMHALCPDLFQISEKDICATLQIKKKYWILFQSCFKNYRLLWPNHIGRLILIDHTAPQGCHHQSVTNIWIYSCHFQYEH